MRHTCVLLLFCLTLPAFAQYGTPRAEVFVGYSYLNADINGLLPRQSAQGANFSFVANFNQWVGLETNFSGCYKSVPIPAGGNASLRDFALLFGPRVHYRWAFAHALFGIDSLGASALGLSDTNGSFSGAIGVGALFMLSRHIGVEGSADYAFSRHNLFAGDPMTQNNYRATGGIVFVFGRASGSTAEPQPRPGPSVSSSPPARQSGTTIASLGVAVVSRDDAGGAQIIAVAPGSPAELAGIRPGDVIDGVNQLQVKAPADVLSALSGIPAGSRIVLRYMVRGLWQTETTIVIGSH